MTATATIQAVHSELITLRGLALALEELDDAGVSTTETKHNDAIAALMRAISDQAERTLVLCSTIVDAIPPRRLEDAA